MKKKGDCPVSKAQPPRYNNLDLFKWVASLFIIAIHTKLFLDNPVGISAFVIAFYALAKCMVPFFFAASTFFMAKKIDWARNSESNFLLMEKNARRIFRMYLIWMLVYTPFTVWIFLAAGASPVNTAWAVILSLFLGGSSASIHLWFLLALFLSLLLMMFIFGRQTEKMWVFLPVALLLYGVRLFANYFPLTSQEPFMGNILETFRWEMFTAPFYCFLGILFARYEDALREKVKWPVRLIAFLLLWAAGTLKHSWAPLAILLHIAFIALVFSIPVGGNPAFFRTLRKASMVIYLIHVMVQFLWGKIFGGTVGTVAFLGVCAVSCAIAFGWCFFSDRKKMAKAGN